MSADPCLRKESLGHKKGTFKKGFRVTNPVLSIVYVTNHLGCLVTIVAWMTLGILRNERRIRSLVHLCH